MSLKLAYKNRFFKRVILTIMLIFLIIFLLWVNIISGSNGLNFSDTFRFFDKESQFIIIVSEIRLPRALGALIVGMLLGLSGVVMQGVLKNPLASPFTLGISQSAGFGASLAIIFFSDIGEFSKFSIVISAFSASMICSLLIIYLGKKVGMSPTALILAGVGLGSLFHSGTMLLQYFTTEINVASTIFWTFGDLSKATYTTLLILFFIFLISITTIWASHWKFDALAYGDDIAFNKGVNVKSFRVIMLLLSSLCTAFAVAFFGIIGFIGLVAPHIVRLIIGNSHSGLIPLSALSGGVLLLSADFFARFIIYPTTLPVGILTSFIGAPMLLYLLVKLGKVR